jgi:CheY-like chemotaxis protein
VTTDAHGSTDAHAGHEAQKGDQGGEHREAHGGEQTAKEPTLTVLVYSDDRNTRAAVLRAIGRRPAAGLPRVEFVECATEPVVIKRMDRGGIDLAVLDGEAVPAGGMGICRQLKDEVYRCPPVLVLLGRPQDGWLATWSRADAVVAHPIDPIVLARTAAQLLAPRAAARTSTVG